MTGFSILRDFDDSKGCGRLRGMRVWEVKRDACFHGGLGGMRVSKGAWEGSVVLGFQEGSVILRGFGNPKRRFVILRWKSAHSDMRKR